MEIIDYVVIIINSSLLQQYCCFCKYTYYFPIGKKNAPQEWPFLHSSVRCPFVVQSLFSQTLNND